MIFFNKAVGNIQNLGSASVILIHHDSLNTREVFIKIKQVSDVCTAPGIDCLIRVAYHKKIVMIRTEGFHHFILNHVYILKLINHYVFKPLLPFEADCFVCLEDIEHELEQIVIVQTEAFFLLVKVAVKNYVVGTGGGQVFLMNLVQTHADKVFVIVRLLKDFADFYHVAGVAKGHLAKGKAALLVDNLQHGIDVGIVEDEKTFRIRDGV